MRVGQALRAEERGSGSPSPRSQSSLESVGSGDLGGGGDYHSTPRWRGTSVFSDQTLQHLSRMSSPGLPSRDASLDLDKASAMGLPFTLMCALVAKARPSAMAFELAL